MGGGDDADVDSVSLGTAESTKRTLVQVLGQTGLCASRKVADFVQEQGAAVGRFEQPAPRRRVFGRGRARGGASEQFDLDQRFGNPGAVEGDHLRVTPPARRVERPGDQFLARARLPENQYRRLGRRHGRDSVEQFPHFLALADDGGERRTVRGHAGRGDGTFNGRDQGVRLKWSRQVVGGPASHAIDRFGNAWRVGQEHDRCRGGHCNDVRRRGGQRRTGDDDVRLCAADGHPVRTGCFGDVEPVAFEFLSQLLAARGVLFDYEHPGHLVNTSRTNAPPSGVCFRERIRRTTSGAAVTARQ